MSDKKISELAAVTDVQDTDEFVIARAGGNNKITGASLKADLGGSSSSIPIADATGVVIDTTTYDNPVTGVGKLTTLVFPAQTAAFAIAIEGDAFPRWLLTADATDGLYMGPGFADPYSLGSVAGAFSGGEGVVEIQGTSRTFLVNVSDTNVGRYNRTNAPIKFGNSATISAVSGVPAIGGNVGDIVIREDGAVGSTLYRCTVAGTAGNATWAAIL